MPLNKPYSVSSLLLRARMSNIPTQDIPPASDVNAKYSCTSLCLFARELYYPYNTESALNCYMERRNRMKRAPIKNDRYEYSPSLPNGARSKASGRLLTSSKTTLPRENALSKSPQRESESAEISCERTKDDNNDGGSSSLGAESWASSLNFWITTPRLSSVLSCPSRDEFFLRS